MELAKKTLSSWSPNTDRKSSDSASLYLNSIIFFSNFFLTSGDIWRGNNIFNTKYYTL
jgi:hypothetical protein